MAARVVALRKALERYWTEQDCMLDVTFYTPEEWAARGEPHGFKARLNVTFEGPLYVAMNHMADGPDRFDISERTRQIAEEHGLWFELGYAWSAHFYAI